jgi:hypothetical protein
MENKNKYKFKDIYFDFLPFFLVSTTAIGFVSGVISCSNHKPNEFFSQMIGYTSIGIMTGLSFPISCPLLGCYVLYKNK